MANTLYDLLNPKKEEEEKLFSSPEDAATYVPPLPPEAPEVPETFRAPAEKAAPVIEQAPVIPEAPKAPSISSQLEDLLAERKRAIADAEQRQWKADLIAGLAGQVGNIVGGAQAMNTKAAVVPTQISVKAPDILSRVESKYKPELEAVMEKYKLLQKAQQDAAEAKLRKEEKAETAEERAYQRQLDRDLKERMFGEAQSYREERGDRLSDKQTEQLSGYNSTLASLERAKTMKKGIDTGPVAGRLNSIASKLGIDDPDVTALKVEALNTVAERIKELSGTASSEKETERLQITLPSMNDSDSVFDKKLAEAEKRIKEASKIRMEDFKKQGKNVSAFEKAPTNETKTVNGVSYKKVPGGWEKVK